MNNSSDPPIPERSEMNYKSNPNPANNKELGTTILYSCPEEKYYFDYPVGDNFTSFYNTININALNVTCNQDGYDFEGKFKKIAFMYCFSSQLENTSTT